MKKISDFIKNNSVVLAILSTIASFLFMLAPVLVYETRVYVGDEKVDTEFNANIIALLKGDITNNFLAIIILSLIGVSVILGILSILLKRKENEKVSSSLALAIAIINMLNLCLVIVNREIFDYFSSSMIENYHGVSIGWGSALSMLFLVFGSIFAIGESNYKDSLNTRGLAEDGVLIALAFVLNFIKLPIHTAGGSVNLQMLPLMIIALRRGPLNGLIASGVVYGILTCLTDGYGFVTYPFDYLIGFGSTAVFGFFRPLILSESQKGYNAKGILFMVIAGILMILIRLIGSTTSSMVFYGLDFIPALTYNAVYIPVSGALALVLLIALYQPLITINRLYPANK
ncbi:MAG: energy-coupled thiamine transporter ThiT [Gammaproteobacteria bacterium]|nr:energy-coupled thiamine transporter ThiT [Gammaproteobacteria bacterium]